MTRINGGGQFVPGLYVLVAMLAMPSFAGTPKKGTKSSQGASAKSSSASSEQKSAEEIEAPVDVPQPVEVPKPVDVPVMAPFTGPASGRPLPPPAPTPEFNLGEPGLEGGSIEDALQRYQESAVVTSAGKREQRLRDIPMSVSWIPAEELEGTGQFTLCDAIQYFPGMECRRGAMRKAAVSAQGLGSNFLSNRLLLLKNGRPETDPWTGIFYPDETMPLTNIKQIEVIKGPGSSLYGSNAFSGVINIIQRNPEDLMKDGRNFGADLRVLGGQDNTYRVQTTVAGAAGPIKAMANYYGFLSDGPKLLSNPALKITDTQEWSKIHQVSGRVKAGAFTLDVEYNNSAVGRPGGHQILDVGNCGRCHYTPRDLEKVENLNVNLQADGKVNDWLRVFAESYVLYKRRVVSLENQITRLMEDTLGKRRRLGGEARALMSFGTLTVTLGGDIKRDTVNNQNILPEINSADMQETIVGGFIDSEFRPLANLVLGAGARYDYYRIPQNVWHNQSSQVSPRASIIYHALPQLTLRTNYGHAFRAPTFAELAINQQMYASTLMGNPYLKAETLDTLEAAVDWWPMSGSARLSCTGFYKKASNFINEEFLFGSTSQFMNVGDAQIVGFEAEAAAKVPQLNSSFDVAYQFLDARKLAADGAVGANLDYAPAHRLYIRGHANLSKDAFADLYAIYVGTRQDPARRVLPDGTRTDEFIELPGYLVANARVGTRLVDGLTVSLIVQNVFNNQYSEMNGFPQPGLSVFTEAKFVY